MCHAKWDAIDESEQTADGCEQIVVEVGRRFEKLAFYLICWCVSVIDTIRIHANDKRLFNYQSNGALSEMCKARKQIL